MRTKHLILAGLVVLSQILQSCLKGEDVYKEKEPTYTELDLNIGGECSLTEKPMSRADALYDDGRRLCSFERDFRYKCSHAHTESQRVSHSKALCLWHL